LDIATPFYHLASAVDLAERTFLAALVAKSDLNVAELGLDETSYNTKVQNFWKSEEPYEKNGYPEGFRAFSRRYKPVTLNFHSVTQVVEQRVPKWKEHKTTFSHIRQYRNVLAHSLSPLREIRDGQIYIPSVERLSDYTDARWSSRRDTNQSHYAPAIEIINNLTQNLLTSLNDLWGILLSWMPQVDTVSDSGLLEHPLSRLSSMKLDAKGMTGYASGYFYTGGSAEVNRSDRRLMPPSDGDPLY
jgi:hypothetical protein